MLCLLTLAGVLCEQEFCGCHTLRAVDEHKNDPQRIVAIFELIRLKRLQMHQVQLKQRLVLTRGEGLFSKCPTSDTRPNQTIEPIDMSKISHIVST